MSLRYLLFLGRNTGGVREIPVQPATIAVSGSMTASPRSVVELPSPMVAQVNVTSSIPGISGSTEIPSPLETQIPITATIASLGLVLVPDPIVVTSTFLSGFHTILNLDPDVDPIEVTAEMADDPLGAGVINTVPDPVQVTVTITPGGFQRSVRVRRPPSSVIWFGR